MSEHKAHSAAGAEPRTLTLRPRSFDRDPPTVTLIKRHAYTEGYDTGDDVYHDGVFIGTVKAYTGSIDTPLKGTRLRRQGKRRRLWSYQTPGTGRTSYGEVSRADCIRDLIRLHEHRSNQ